MDLLLRSDIKQSEKKIQDTHIDVTLAKLDIKDIKEDVSNMKGDLTVVKSGVSNIEKSLATTRTDLMEQIQHNRRIAGRSPFSFPSNPTRPLVTRGKVGNSSDCGKGCS